MFYIFGNENALLEAFYNSFYYENFEYHTYGNNMSIIRGCLLLLSQCENATFRIIFVDGRNIVYTNNVFDFNIRDQIPQDAGIFPSTKETILFNSDIDLINYFEKKGLFTKTCLFSFW